MLETTVTYRIDGGDRLVDVNEGWVSFAKSNGGDALLPASITGRLLWDFLTDATTIQLYRILCEQVRRERSSIQFQFRCDAPEIRRLMTLEMTCVDGTSIEFAATPVMEHTRGAVPFVGVSHAGPNAPLISMCGWCKRVRLSDRWVEVEEGIDAMGLFQQNARVPAVTHGICAPCEHALSAELDKVTVTLGALPAVS